MAGCWTAVVVEAGTTGGLGVTAWATGGADVGAAATAGIVYPGGSGVPRGGLPSALQWYIVVVVAFRPVSRLTVLVWPVSTIVIISPVSRAWTR
jgi:hypothetical protein